MKKVLAICLSLVMVMSMSFTAFAEPRGFVSSPSGTQAPELIGFKNESEDCVAQLTVTAFSDRTALSDEVRKNMEEAYNIIVNTTELSTLNGEISEIAANLGVEVSSLAVSEMFDISCTDCSSHVDHGRFDITLKPETLNNFVCLLHYYNGEWRIVKDVQVTNNGEHLEFTEDEFSPFAIVVNTEVENDDPPQTGDNSMISIYAIVMAVSAVAIIIVWRKFKKQSV